MFFFTVLEAKNPRSRCMPESSRSNMGLMLPRWPLIAASSKEDKYALTWEKDTKLKHSNSSNPLF